MLTEDSLREAVRAAGIDVEPVFHDEIASTSTDAVRLADDGAAEWTVVATAHQSAGRGRLGRTWVSARGRALTFSLVLRPSVDAERAPLLSLLAAEAMAAACHEVTDVDVRSKWPNDLLVGERKVGGILPEARVADGGVSHVVLGIGMNLTTADEEFPEELRARAGSVVPGGSVDAAAVLAAFLSGYREEYRPDDPEFAMRVVSGYVAQCATIGRRVRATTVEGHVLEGTAVGMDHLGGLVVEVAHGHDHVVAFGEVAHLD